MTKIIRHGPCSTKGCTDEGTRANGAEDIAPMATRTGVFAETYYCEECRHAAAQRSLGGMKSGRPVWILGDRAGHKIMPTQRACQ